MKKALLALLLPAALLLVLSGNALAADAGGLCLIVSDGTVPVLRDDGTVVVARVSAGETVEDTGDGLVVVRSDGTEPVDTAGGVVTVSGLNAGGREVAAEAGSDGTVVFNGAVKLALTLTGAEEGASYLLTAQTAEDVPKADNLIYIAQQKAGEDGTAAFTVYPSDPGLTQIYSVYLSSNAVEEGSLSDRTVVVRFQAVEGAEREYMVGDLNGDGHIYANDAVPILKHAAGMDVGLNEAQLAAADVNGDGHIYANDAVPVLKVAAGLFDTIEEALAG